MIKPKSIYISLFVLFTVFVYSGDTSDDFLTEALDDVPEPTTIEPVEVTTEAPETTTESPDPKIESLDPTTETLDGTTEPPNDADLATATSTLDPSPDKTTEKEENSVNVKSDIFRKVILAETYDKFTRPFGTNGSGPVVITITMFLRNVETIDDELMEYTAQLTFREEWIDSRLSFAHLHQVEYIQLSTPDAIWIPDVFFSNAQSGTLHDLMKPNFFGRLYSNGRILVSYRITLTLSCPMQLHYYPMDSQDCYIKMASYGWTNKDIVLKWPDSASGAGGMTVSKLNLPRFRLESHVMKTCLSLTKTGNYSCIELKLRFSRQFGYYMIRFYAPCIMLVLVSWISFWLEPTATEARISLAITAILTVVTQTDGINQSVPPASYIKAVDVWTFMIQIMVFATVLQFAYVNYLAKYHWRRMARRLNITDEEEWSKVGVELRRQTEKKAKRVDSISKILFPIIFALFNLVYWVAYMGTHPK